MIPVPAVYALTPQGARLARMLAKELGGSLHLPRKLAASDEAGFESLPALVAEIFHAHPAHVFVAATGIVVRSIAPLLRGKAVDPAVIALDQAGRFAVSLLSGHLGGANALARRVASLTGGQAVITTATDTAGLPSLDLLAKDSGLVIENLEAVKTVNAALLEGGIVQVFDPYNRLSVPLQATRRFEWVASPQDFEPGRAWVAVDWRAFALPKGCLALRPRVVVAGVGCRKGVSARSVAQHILAGCAKVGAAPASLAALASIEEKRQEPGLLEAARILGLETIFYPASRLAQVTVPTPSALVRRHMGVDSVCEAAAILASGASRLLLTKTKTDSVTLALALAG